MGWNMHVMVHLVHVVRTFYFGASVVHIGLTVSIFTIS